MSKRRWFHDRGFNRAYSREDCELSAQSVAYILCRRFGISRELPDLSKLPELFRGRQDQGRLEVLKSIEDKGKALTLGDTAPLWREPSSPSPAAAATAAPPSPAPATAMVR